MIPESGAGRHGGYAAQAESMADMGHDARLPMSDASTRPKEIPGCLLTSREPLPILRSG